MNILHAHPLRSEDGIDFFLLFDRKFAWELHIKDDVEISALFSLASSCALSFSLLALVHDKSFSLNNFDAAWRLNLVDSDNQVSAIECSHLDWLALDDIEEVDLVSVEEHVADLFACEQFRV